MAEVGIKDLLQAGVHFGHQTHRWNPKMRRYIFAERGGIYLIDLKKTLAELNRARNLVRETVLAGKGVMFVCTKRQLADIVRAEAERCGAFYVTERWLGGMLTNFQTIKKNIRRLKELDRGVEEGAYEFYTKKERLLLDRERLKLERYLSGIKDMTQVPGLVFVVDAKKEEIAVREAHRLDIPVVAIADTNADPDMLTVPIAGNDDAIRSVTLITGALASEIEAARREVPDVRLEEEEAYTYSTDVGESEAAGSKPKRRRSRPRRRPKPDVIARVLQTEEGGEGAPTEGAEDAAKDAKAAAGDAKAAAGDAKAAAGDAKAAAGDAPALSTEESEAAVTAAADDGKDRPETA